MGSDRSTTTIRTRRDVLRRRRRERQVIVFGLMAIVVGAIFVGAASVYAGKAASPFAEPFVTSAALADRDIRLACPPANQTALPARQVVVRVLNSTQIQGLAATVLEDMVGRGYVSGGAGNWGGELYPGTARIMFGIDGVHEAYTVARNFPDAELILDNREGHSVDVVLGELYQSLRPLYAEELKDGVILTATAQCKQAQYLTPEPAPRTVPPELTPSTEPSASASPDESDE